MTILYSLVAHGETILCSYGVGADSTVRSILPNIATARDAKTTYAANDCLFHVMVDNGMIYLCTSETNSSKRQPFAFLAEIRRRLTTGLYGDRLFSLSEFGLQDEFGHVLAEQMQYYSSNEGPDRLSTLQSQVDEVRDIMTQNIENVLKRGENLSTLMDKTEDLEASSNTFRKTAGRVHRKMWWRNTKMTIILVVVVLVIILAIVLIILFSTGVLPVKNTNTTPLPPTTTTK